MSWIVRNLILEAFSIKNSILKKSGDQVDPDLDDDDYNSILIIERQVNLLAKKGKLSELEVTIISLALEGKSIKMIAEELGKSIYVVRSVFFTATNKIAFALGGYYTNAGYIDYIKNKFKLTDEQLSVLQKEVSRFK